METNYVQCSTLNNADPSKSCNHAREAERQHEQDEHRKQRTQLGFEKQGPCRVIDVQRSCSTRKYTSFISPQARQHSLQSFWIGRIQRCRRGLSLCALISCPYYGDAHSLWMSTRRQGNPPDDCAFQVLQIPDLGLPSPPKAQTIASQHYLPAIKAA